MSAHKKALVTGGAGFIGHHLAGALLAKGLEVTVLDDLSVGRRENVPAGARFIQGDVRDPEAVTVALAGVDCVFHEAAVVSIRASVEGFLRDADVNLTGTLNLLQCLADSGVRKAVFASSMAVYADSECPVPLGEGAPLAPISPYGIAKLAAERYWLMMCSHYGLSGTVLRYFNTYGPGQTPTPYVGVITIFISRLLRGEMPVIFGDGEQRRDFVHVDDIASGVLASPANRPGTYNLGTGRGTSLNQLAALLASRINPGLSPQYAPAQAGELRFSIADITAAQRALAYRPRHTIESRIDDVIADVRGRSER